MWWFNGIESSIAQLQKYNQDRIFSDDVKDAAEKVAKFVCSKGINPPKGEVPTTQSLRLNVIVPLLNRILERADKEKNDSVLELFGQLLSIVRVASAAVTIYSKDATQDGLLKAVDELEKHIFNAEYLENFTANSHKNALVRSTAPLGRALDGYVGALNEKFPAISPRILFLRCLIGAATVSREIFANGYYGYQLLFQIRMAYPHANLDSTVFNDFAQDALAGQQRKFIIIPSTPFFVTNFTILFTDQEPREIFFRDSSWRLYTDHHTLKFDSLDACLNSIRKDHTPVNLPFPTSTNARLPLCDRWSTLFDSRKPIMESIEPTLMVQVIDSIKRGGHFWRREVYFSSPTRVTNFFQSLIKAAMLSRFVTSDPGYHGFAYVVETFRLSPEKFQKCDHYQKADLQAYAKRHLTIPNTFLALPSFYENNGIILYTLSSTGEIKDHPVADYVDASNLTVHIRFYGSDPTPQPPNYNIL